jgi:CubicO group peptidase (beta-lactamase class C family)
MNGKTKIFTVIALTIFFLAAMSPVFAQEDKQKLAEEIKKFDAFYQQSVKDWNVVGSSFMLIHDNRVLDKQVYGTAHVENKTPVDDNTIYHWASITKTFTGIAIMQLRDRGKLSLDDPIVKYVPEIAQVHNPFGKTEEITIRHLLSHTGGFRAGTFPWGGDKDWHPGAPTEWAQVAAMLPYTQVEFKPGSRYSYSNPGIVFLGRVIEKIAGEDYEVYVDKNIFKPLEMHRAFFDAAPYHLLKHRSHSYWRNEDDTLKPYRFDMNTGITVSNGGLNATVADMAKYLNFLAGDPKNQAIYDQVLKRSTLEEMWQPIADSTEKDPKHGQNYRESIGLTFFIEDNFGRRFVAHSGGQNGFTTHFYYRPETRTGYLIAFNTWTAPTKANPNRRTSVLDRTIKEYLFKNIFPLLKN